MTIYPIVGRSGGFIALSRDFQGRRHVVIIVYFGTLNDVLGCCVRLPGL